MTERWAPIVSRGGHFEVSTLGRVRRTDNGCIYALQREAKGYICLRMPRVGNLILPPIRVHIAVLEAFVGPRPVKHDASHINGVRDDNRLENLIWESRRDNILRKRQHGTMVRGEAHKCSKLKADQVIHIRTRRAEGASLRELSGDYGVSKALVSQICLGKAWKYLLHEGIV